MTTTNNSKTTRAINNYGMDTCRKAYEMHSRDGEGASTVGHYLGLTTRQADAAINAGRELCAAGR